MQLLNNKLTQRLIECKCLYPRMYNGVICRCGQCVNCLKIKREENSFKIDIERKSKTCVHTFGMTLTYDNKHLPVFDLEHKTQPYRYDKIDGYKETNPNIIPVLNRKDCQKFNKRCRRALEYKFTKQGLVNPFFLRFYYVGEYGGNHFRPHYHYIVFVHNLYSENPLVVPSIDYQTGELIDKQLTPTEMFNLMDTIEKLCLNQWDLCRRFQTFNPVRNKTEWHGKTIEIVKDGAYGMYLGKYLNKLDLAEFAPGSKYVPEFRQSSQRSKNFGVFGGQWIEDNWDYLVDLLTYSNETNQPFNPTYTQNEYTKALPNSLKSAFLRYFDGLKSTQLNDLNFFINRLTPEQREQWINDDSFLCDTFDKPYKVVKPVNTEFTQIRYSSAPVAEFKIKVRHYDYVDLANYEQTNTYKNKVRIVHMSQDLQEIADITSNQNIIPIGIYNEKTGAFKITNDARLRDMLDAKLKNGESALELAFKSKKIHDSRKDRVLDNFACNARKWDYDTTIETPSQYHCKMMFKDLEKLWEFPLTFINMEDYVPF